MEYTGLLGLKALADFSEAVGFGQIGFPRNQIMGTSKEKDQCRRDFSALSLIGLNWNEKVVLSVVLAHAA